MFSKFPHKLEDDIKLFAGPAERHALATVLKQKADIYNAEIFIDRLHYAVLKQASETETINKTLGYRLFHKEDYCIFVCQHLSTMCQDDFDKVLRHLRALFIDRNQYWVMVAELDDCLSIAKKIYIFNGIIVPWLHWVRSAKNKSDTEKDNTNTTTNKTSDNNNVMCNQCTLRCCSCWCAYKPAGWSWSRLMFQKWLRDSNPCG